MIPYIIGLIGGYLIGNSTDKQIFDKGGKVDHFGKFFLLDFDFDEEGNLAANIDGDNYVVIYSEEKYNLIKNGKKVKSSTNLRDVLKFADGGQTSDCGCQKMEKGGKVNRKCKMRYDDGGHIREIEIEFDESDPRIIGVEYSLKKGGKEIEFSGTLRSYHTGRDTEYEFEPGYFPDEESEKYYSEHWEDIEEQILDAFYKN